MIGGGLVGAGIGAKCGRRQYRATGIVRIAFARGAVMTQTDQNASLPMFDGYIQAQGELMASRETVHKAMGDETWSAVEKKQKRALSDEQFATSLNVETRHGSDHIHVSYTDRDPRIAAAAVRAVIAVFQRNYDRDEARSERQRMDELKSRQSALSAELKGIEDQIGPAGNAPGGPTAAIEPLYEAAVGRLGKFRAALVDLQCAIAGNPTRSATPAARPTSPAEIAANTMLNAYISEQVKHEMELTRLTESGCGPSHPLVLRLQAAIREDRDQVAKCEQAVEGLRKAPAQESSLADLKGQEATLARRVADAEADIKRLAEQRSRLVTLAQRAAELRQRSDEVTARIDVLTTEASLGSRLTIVEGGDKPMTASLDNRPKTAALGGALGATAPILALILLAGVRRRYRNAIEVAEDLATRVPFVAVLPAIGEAASEGGDAARAVHQLRVRLQPQAATTSLGRAYLVTSPETGDGKSGTALSLGLSFAAAGYRTLLIDGDLSTRRLTRGLCAEEAVGFRDAADGREPVVRSLRAGLCFMPAGRCRPEDQYTLTGGPVVRLLDRVRPQFDIILIDSDPLLTGVASAVMAGQVDGVLFNVTRDQSASAVREAMRLLEQQRATVGGCIFNRDRHPDAPPALLKQASERRTSELQKDRDASPSATGTAPAAATAPKRIPRRRALDLPRDPDTASAAPPPAAAVQSAEPKPAFSAPAEAPTLSDRLRAFGPLVAAVMASLALSEDENLALIDPPASAPKITIFPAGPADETPYWQPRVA